jgi:hypothetical protein
MMIKIHRDPRVDQKFQSYPKEILAKLNSLRELIISTADELNIDTIEETLKWEEPSYLVKKGSTIRMDWKAKSPNQYALYFKCTSKLIPTFKKVYGDKFKYEKTRAIVFNLDEKIPVEELRVCIGLALQYHYVKNLPRLGR